MSTYSWGKTLTSLVSLSIIWKTDLSNRTKLDFFQDMAEQVLFHICIYWTLTNNTRVRHDGLTNPGSSTL